MQYILHVLYSWTLSIVLSLSKMLTKYNVSEIGFYLRPQLKPTQLGPIDRTSISCFTVSPFCTDQRLFAYIKHSRGCQWLTYHCYVYFYSRINFYPSNLFHVARSMLCPNYLFYICLISHIRV
jgi:hypothetical protein